MSRERPQWRDAQALSRLRQVYEYLDKAEQFPLMIQELNFNSFGYMDLLLAR